MSYKQKRTLGCDCCDFLRCVKTVKECGSGVARKVDVAKNIRYATVCVLPESPHYGEQRVKNDATCEHYKDWFYNWDFDGERDNVRAEQAKLVTQYRRDRLGVETPYDGNGGAGSAPCLLGSYRRKGR